MPPAAPREVQIFLVDIEYREPTYELRHGRRESPYRWVYEIPAADEDEARASALREFDWMSKASRVGWVREVVRVGVMVKPRAS